MSSMRTRAEGTQLQIVLDREQDIAKQALKEGNKVRPLPLRNGTLTLSTDSIRNGH